MAKENFTEALKHTIKCPDCGSYHFDHSICNSQKCIQKRKDVQIRDELYIFRKTMMIIHRQELEGKYYNLSIITLFISWGFYGFIIIPTLEQVFENLHIFFAILLTPLSIAISWLFLATIPSWIQWMLKGLQLFKKSGCNWGWWFGPGIEVK